MAIAGDGLDFFDNRFKVVANGVDELKGGIHTFTMQGTFSSPNFEQKGLYVLHNLSPRFCP